MKHDKFNTLFVSLLACYFLLAGSGYNIVSYCCQTFANEGIETIAMSSCNDIHHSSNIEAIHQHEDTCCQNFTHKPESCHLFRICSDIPSFNYLQKTLLIKCIV